MALLRLFALLAISTAPAAATEQGSQLAVNPIRRVVTMLQLMQKRVEDEGKAEAKLFEKFMCWCKNGGSDLGQAISAAENKIPRVEQSLQAATAEKSTLENDLAKATSDRADAKKALADAAALRAKQAAAFAKESSDLKTNIAALGQAISALEKGVTGFLQTTAAATLRRLTIDMDISSVDRDTLTSFLSHGHGNGYVPQSGQIIGILKQMKETMENSLADVTNDENTAIADFAALAAAKEKEAGALGAAIEAKTERHGAVGVDIVNMKQDLVDTTKAHAADQKFAADLQASCAAKKAEWGARSKTRTEELLAIAEAVKVLNDDDALELFKKTLPSPSFLQTQSMSSVRERTLSALQPVRRRDSRLNLIAMAIRGRKVSFAKVIAMIDDMVALLGNEQADDDSKKAWCEAELDASEDKHKQLELKISDLSKAVEETEAAIATLTKEIADLVAGVAALDKEVAEASADRKEQHAEFVQSLSASNAAKDLIAFAKNRLQKFYNPELYVPPPDRELTEEQRITQNMGGSLAPAAAPGGIAGTGISASFEQVAPAPPPATWDAYQKKGQENAGVMTLMDMLSADLDKEIQEMTVDEKNAQEEYEQFMDDSATRRADDSKSIADKEAAKADAEVNLQKMKKEKKATMLEAMATAKVISELHADCDWLISNFEARKAARAGEVDSLKNAKAVLSGADYSLVQTARAHLRGSFQ